MRCQESTQKQKCSSYATILLFMFLFFLNLRVQVWANDEIVIKVKKISDRVLFIKTGETSVMPNMAALASKEGLIIIDSHTSAKNAVKIRNMVEWEFGRKDFLYLINTHGANDHSGGNQVFSEATIVGHINSLTEMNRLKGMMLNPPPNVNEMMDKRIADMKALQKKAQGTEEEIRLKEAILYFQGTFQNMLSPEFDITPPAIAFNDSLTIQLEDMTLHLNFSIFGYSTSDILIHVPEEKLLIVGDVFNKDRIPILRPTTDIERWIRLFEKYVSGKSEIENVIGGHGELMTVKDVKDQLDYIKDLKESVTGARSAGSTLEETKEMYAFKKKYKHLSHLRSSFSSVQMDLHGRNIENVWKMLDE